MSAPKRVAGMGAILESLPIDEFGAWKRKLSMTDEAVKVTGGCLCGKVRYEAQAFLKSGYYCHCKQCQKSSGAPVEIGIPIESGTLKFIKNEPKYFKSSDVGKRGFCGNCGSRIVWRANDPTKDHWTNVSVCSLDKPEDVRPKAHTFVDTQLPWFELADELPRVREDDDAAFLETLSE
jgi:hypothetical protein